MKICGLGFRVWEREREVGRKKKGGGMLYKWGNMDGDR